MPSDRKKILIAGASGLVGCALVKLFTGRPDWDVVAVSRRKPFVPLGNAQHISVDLLDRAECARIFGAISDVTHVGYAALNEQLDDIVGGWRSADQIGKNRAMLANLFDPLIAAAHDFRHIAIVHGLKAYGNHAGADLPVPLRETLPRHPIDNFYYDQEDYIADKQKGKSWSWTVLRPAMIAGDAIGANMNSFLVLAVFAALRKEAGLDLPMAQGRSFLTDSSDADLIAEAILWAGSSPNARNEIFNVCNGDIFALHDGIPVMAEAIGVPLGEPRSYDIIAELKAMEPLWATMVKKYGLRAPSDFDSLFGATLQVAGGWTAEAPPGAEMAFGLASTIKIRQAGFHACIDTHDMMRKYVRRYRELGIIPQR
jgi:nucleoside-diphosphate-sugar epimerase